MQCIFLFCYFARMPSTIVARTRKIIARRKSSTRALNKYLRRLDSHPTPVQRTHRSALCLRLPVPRTHTCTTHPPTTAHLASYLPSSTRVSTNSPYYQPTSPAYPPDASYTSPTPYRPPDYDVPTPPREIPPSTLPLSLAVLEHISLPLDITDYRKHSLSSNSCII